jgi:hypothetical protein
MSKLESSIGQAERVNSGVFASENLPIRKGSRPTTFRGPLHIQCNGHGDLQYLHQLTAEALSWPYIEHKPSLDNPSKIISIRLEEGAVATDSAAFISPREFARVLLGVRTIYLALPLVCAHWAIVRGWAEPHYLCSYGLMPAGTVVLYTPKNDEELSVCYSLFFAAYDFASKKNGGTRLIVWSIPTGNSGPRPAFCCPYHRAASVTSASASGRMRGAGNSARRKELGSRDSIGSGLGRLL